MTKTNALSIVLALTSACTVIHGDDFTQDEGCDLQLRMRDFSPHVVDTTTVLLSRANRNGSMRRIEAVAVFDPLGSVNVDLRMPNAVQPRTSVEQGLAAVDFYADFDDVEGFSFPGDHTWVLEDVCTTGPEEFPHNTDFVPIRILDPGGAGVFTRFCGTEGIAGTPVEIRVSRALPLGDGEVTHQAIGFYRLDDASRSADGVYIPFVVNVDFDTVVEVMVDRDRDGIFDAGTDDAWRYDHRGGAVVECDSLPLDEVGCPRVLAGREPLPVCLFERRDLVVFVSPTTIANRASTLLHESWARAVTP
ncbi:MAG: hypothetical protein MUE69_03785 [Myxococcota bacterium]|jgi:hypothetical protein|nr:hypothetical protein [Myxococcota bacterium]